MKKWKNNANFFFVYTFGLYAEHLTNAKCSFIDESSTCFLQNTGKSTLLEMKASNIPSNVLNIHHKVCNLTFTPWYICLYIL